MREIKFRAWDGDKIVYDFGVFRPQMADGLKILIDEKYAQEQYGVKEWKVMQFTGLKDKNGKEIYEGDYLEVKFDEKYTTRVSWRGKPDAIAEVYWDYNGFRLNCKGEKDRRYADFEDFINSRDWDDNYLMMNLKHTKIIGNVYENPEIKIPIFKLEL